AGVTGPAPQLVSPAPPGRAPTGSRALPAGLPRRVGALAGAAGAAARGAVVGGAPPPAPARLAGLRPQAGAAIADGLTGSPPGPRRGRYPCRSRAADGTWRHVESTLSRYQDPGGPDQMLVTARDISAQVELRRQVTHLTYHDPLTGLPNRAFIEQRTHAVIG